MCGDKSFPGSIEGWRLSLGEAAVDQVGLAAGGNRLGEMLGEGGAEGVRDAIRHSPFRNEMMTKQTSIKLQLESLDQMHVNTQACPDLRSCLRLSVSSYLEAQGNEGCDITNLSPSTTPTDRNVSKASHKLQESPVLKKESRAKCVHNTRQ